MSARSGRDSSTWLVLVSLACCCARPAAGGELTLPALAFDGTEVAQPRTFDLPVLAYDGRPVVDAQENALALQVFRFPDNPQQGRYLSLGSTTFPIGQPVRIDYAALPVARQPHRLMIFRLKLETDGAPDTGYSWNVVWASRAPASGTWERADLPSGGFLACVGLGTRMSDYARTPDAYDECLDFYVMTPASPDHAPVLSLSTSSPRAGQPFEVRYQGLVAAPRAWLGLFRDGDVATSRVTFHETRGATEGTWKLRVATPGTYFLRLFYDGGHQLPRGLATLTVAP